MKNEVIKEIEQKMANILNNEQKEKLKEVLLYTFYNIEITNVKENLLKIQQIMLVYLSLLKE